MKFQTFSEDVEGFAKEAGLRRSSCIMRDGVIRATLESKSHVYMISAALEEQNSDLEVIADDRDVLMRNFACNSDSWTRAQEKIVAYENE